MHVHEANTTQRRKEHAQGHTAAACLSQGWKTEVWLQHFQLLCSSANTAIILHVLNQKLTGEGIKFKMVVTRNPALISYTKTRLLLNQLKKSSRIAMKLAQARIRWKHSTPKGTKWTFGDKTQVSKNNVLVHNGS